MTSFKMAANDSFNLSQKRCTLNQIFCFRWHIFHAIRHIIWTLRSEDGHGNKNVKKGIYVENIKQQLCMCSTLFCTFPSRHCTTTTWKCLISRSMVDVNKPRRNFPSLSELEYGYWEFNSGEFAYIWQRTWVELIAMEIEGTRIHFLSNVFAPAAILGS